MRVLSHRRTVTVQLPDGADFRRKGVSEAEIKRRISGAESTESAVKRRGRAQQRESVWRPPELREIWRPPELRVPTKETEQTEVAEEAAKTASSSSNTLSTLEPLESKLRRILPAKPALPFKKAETRREKSRRENFFGVPIFQTDGSGGIRAERGGERGKRGKDQGEIERVEEKGRLGEWRGAGGRERSEAVKKNTSSSFTTTLTASAANSSSSSSPLNKIKGRLSAAVEKWKTRKKPDATVKVQ